MSAAEALALLAVAKAHVLNSMNEPYELDLRLAIDDTRTAASIQRFDSLREEGKIVVVAFLDRELDVLLARRGRSTAELLETVVEGLIEALEAGNATRPPGMFCAAVGVLARDKDPQRGERWLEKRLRAILGVIDEAADKFPATSDDSAEPLANKTKMLLNFMKNN
ncbi:hypothetical protein B0H16DRAFT_1473305 [Mycena metata]|uniref:Uncharacterized protein n=1 Tax=Mycena metata TaxID=1033252 RepID=A0AAD7MLR0_9AGAR|nr:hypothetical protein B0H16DRAFT_1473305 [Mycena metata]